MSDPEKAALLRGVGKRYGSHWAVRDLDLDLDFGQVVGFIGPNGAGKTTLIRMMTGLSAVSAGQIEILGADLTRQARSPDGIGMVAEHPQFVPYLSARKNLRLLARIRNVATEEDIADTLRKVGLDPQDRRPVRGYSLGMRQRLGVAQALMERPRLLFLDEPTNGLDPRGIVEFRELIRQLATAGVAVFVASHLLTELEQVCDRVLFVRHGRVLEELDLHRSQQEMVRLSVTGPDDVAALREWAAHTGIALTDQNGTRWPTVELASTDVPELLAHLVRAGVRIEAVDRAQRSLEQRFLELTGSESEVVS
ncbi:MULTISPECIES: ABC transporter ATP-binding protein [unclassified Actinopolyspora]|uniref:ABC transporter ATP-binding protein n=1 Tax=unclassified Actinopolyspora TaxID=2639451 RepID=UPI0013F65DDA|nr:MULTISPECIES: ABC transporter ATP-binding protein [unclassified Actinopolyspora]NHD15674.1 ABC transporter ATP-binding protein [Actinopolyspora sp. BKK2]NHE75112.1 ABC transporter ATP-binding protein [Actinopolyspora sp. BKK1]